MARFALQTERCIIRYSDRDKTIQALACLWKTLLQSLQCSFRNEVLCLLAQVLRLHTGLGVQKNENNTCWLTRSTLLLYSERCVPPQEILQGPYRSSICSSPWRGTHSHNYTALGPAPPNKTTHRHAHTTVSPHAPIITHWKQINGLHLNYVYGLLK